MLKEETEFLTHTGYVSIKNAVKVDEDATKIVRTAFSIAICRQMTVETSGSNYLGSTFDDSINVFDCNLYSGLPVFTFILQH